MRSALLLRLALAAPALLVCTSCPDDELSTTPPAAADASGSWSGVWAEENDMPLFGDLVFTFVQGTGGAVEGTVALQDLACLGVHDFVGTVSGLAMEGEVVEDGLQVSFSFDLRRVDEEMPELEGSFRIEQGSECVVSEAVFVASLQIPAGTQPLSTGWTLPPGVPPVVDLGGSWSGERVDFQSEGPVSLELILLQVPGGHATGFLLLDGAPHPFAGAVGGTALVGRARGPRGQLHLAAHASGPHLEGEIESRTVSGTFLLRRPALRSPD